MPLPQSPPVHILLQGEFHLANVHKLLLLCVSYWCILVLLEGAVPKRTLGPVRIVISLDGDPAAQEFIEPLVRWVRLCWQLSGVDIEIAVEALGCGKEWVVLLERLAREGLIVPHLSGPPDFTLRPRGAL